MKQQYFIVVLAHSFHGRLRRLHIPHTVIYAILALAAFGLVTTVGVVTSYGRMALKVADYNSLRQDFDTLRAKYRRLQRTNVQTNEQLAALQLFATEVSLSYGIIRKLEGPPDISLEAPLMPGYKDTVETYNFLRSANFSKFYRHRPRLWQANVRPSLWPVAGRLLSYYGMRTDPFSGIGSFHAGVDISAPVGTPVKATADGVVTLCDWSGNYGRLVIVDHGGGLQTYYAHLSRFEVIPGQEVRRGQIVGASGASGRVTSPHLHYEVWHGGNPINPYRYLAKSPTGETALPDFPFD
jgi:murein DD-endopeptidase MepM/ murein hydrolase activator NlpD